MIHEETDDFSILTSLPGVEKAEMKFMFIPTLDDLGHNISSGTITETLKKLINDVDESQHGVIWDRPHSDATALCVFPEKMTIQFRINHARAWTLLPRYTQKHFDQGVFYACVADSKSNAMVNLKAVRQNQSNLIISLLPEIMNRRDEVWHKSICYGLKRLLSTVETIPTFYNIMKEPIDALVKEHTGYASNN